MIPMPSFGVWPDISHPKYRHDKCPPGDLFVDGSPDVVHQLVTQPLCGVIVTIVSVVYRHDREGLSGLLIERERVRNMDVQRGGDRAVNRHLFE